MLEENFEEDGVTTQAKDMDAGTRLFSFSPCFSLLLSGSNGGHSSHVSTEKILGINMCKALRMIVIAW